MAKKKIQFDKEKSKLKSLNDNIGFPSSTIRPEDKKEDYHRQWAEKIYTLYRSGKTWMTGTQLESIDYLRSYSDGRQSMEEVKDWVLGKAPKPQNMSPFDADGFDTRENLAPEAKRKAWTNIDFSPVSVAPKIKTKINEHIRSMYYEMTVKAIDSFSAKTEEHSKYKLWFQKENRKWLASSLAAAGLPAEQPDFMPENLDELELYASTGGFKVPYSIAMEDLIKHTFEVSDWDKEVAERLRDDLFTLGMALIREVYDPELKRIVVKYVDPKFGGLQFSHTRGFKDSEYSYELEFMELSRIRQILEMSHENAASLAYSFADSFGNPAAGQFDNYNTIHSADSGDTFLGCDFFKIPVFFAEFVDIDNEQYVEFKDKQGRKRTKKYNGNLQENEQLKNNEKRYRRQVYWIPNTEYTWGWGKSEYIPRDSFSKPRLSMRGVRLMTTPLLEQILPFIKGLNLAWIKAQHFISLAVANGLAVDIGSLKNISVGKDKSFDPMEVLNFYRQSSFLLYKRHVSMTGMGRYNTPPIIPINNAMKDNIQAQFDAMNVYMQKIEDVSGIMMESTGKAADPHVAKFNMQVSVQGTNEIINGIARAQTDIQEDICVNICYRIRSYSRVNKFIADSYGEVIGKRRMKSVLDAEKNHVEYGITIEASDITEEKQAILAMIQQAITPTGEDGMGALLDPSESVIVMDMVHQRQNLRRIGLVLGWMLKKKKREQDEQKKNYIALQGQQNKELEQVKAQAQREQHQFEMEKIQAEFWSQFTITHGTPPPFRMGQTGSPSDLQRNLNKGK